MGSLPRDPEGRADRFPRGPAYERGLNVLLLEGVELAPQLVDGLKRVQRVVYVPDAAREVEYLLRHAVTVTAVTTGETSSWPPIPPATLARVRLSVAAACLLAALIGVSAATAGDVQSIRVVDAGRPETQAFSRDVLVTIESPGSYVSDSPGEWTGPPFAVGQQNATAGTTRIDWAVTFRDRTADSPAAAAAANANGWPVDQKFNLSVPLFVAGRLVGTLPAYAVVTQAGGAQKARFEATAAIPLGPGAQALVHFLTPAPNADDYFVQGGILASTWNRGEVLQALTLIRVEGNLAPKTLSIRVDRAARAVRGKVVDPFYNPLVGVPVVEQRWNGKAWKALRVGRTTNDGTYRIAGGAGRFRTVVNVNGTSLTSAEVSIT